MPDKAFLDTNILVYAFSSMDVRKPVAEELIIRGGTVGIQTLNEFVNVARSKFKAPWHTVLDWLRIVDKLCPPPMPLTLQGHRQGLTIARAYGYHIYDSLMLSAAIEASCTIFYSEDMQSGQVIGGMAIQNPFA